MPPFLLFTPTNKQKQKQKPSTPMKTKRPRTGHLSKPSGFIDFREFYVPENEILCSMLSRTIGESYKRLTDDEKEFCIKKKCICDCTLCQKENRETIKDRVF